jgi:hypothetical protein
MGQQVFGIPAFHKRNGQFGYGQTGKGDVEAGVGVNLVEIVDGDIFGGALVFQDIFGAEDGGYVLINNNIPGFLDDEHIDLEGLGGKRIVGLELEDIPELEQFELDSL